MWDLELEEASKHGPNREDKEEDDAKGVGNAMALSKRVSEAT